MTLQEAIDTARPLAARHKLPAYVHTSLAFGYNFRFGTPLESLVDTTGSPAHTVAIVWPDGRVFKEAKGAQ